MTFAFDPKDAALAPEIVDTKAKVNELVHAVNELAHYEREHRRRIDGLEGGRKPTVEAGPTTFHPVNPQWDDITWFTREGIRVCRPPDSMPWRLASDPYDPDLIVLVRNR